MDWMQLLAIVLINGAMFMWSRSESRSDHRYAQMQIDRIIDMMHEINLGYVDFHHRLKEIEENMEKNK